MSEATLNQRWGAQVVGTLVSCGVRHAVISPGSRSTPLALAFADRPDLTTWPVIDERSAAFFALGLSKATGTPAAAVCTSGTAGAHFLPAVIEASEGATPLMVLTADRPWELHGFGAPQTIEQSTLFGAFPRLIERLPAPEEAGLAHLPHVIARAAFTAVEARGPVHLNVPFREPLASEAPGPIAQMDGPSFSRSERRPHVDRLREALSSAERALIVCGPRERRDGWGGAIERLARELEVPVLAEAASNARFGFDTISAYDAVLHDQERARELRPDVVLRFGGGLTLKSLQVWLDDAHAREFVVAEDSRIFDPSHRAEQVIFGSAPAVCEALRGVTTRSGGYRARWHELQSKVFTRLEAPSPELTEPSAARELIAALPAGAALVLSSSMPIRDADSFALRSHGRLEVFSNRGVNGIDGVMSTALGIAAGSQRPTALLIGDVAAIHDLNAWVTAKQLGLSLTVVVVNNDGGGIFSFLPIADRTPHFERLFGTPHGLDLAHLAALSGATLHRPPDVPAYRRAIERGLEGGLHLIEVRSDRRTNVELHRSAIAALAPEVP